MGQTTPATQWAEALSHMRIALDVLDKSEAPPHIGAHLDLAIARLEEQVAQVASSPAIDRKVNWH